MTIEHMLDIDTDPDRRRAIRGPYLRWRAQNGLPVRCDNPACKFHAIPLIWNNCPLQPIVDHISGNKSDNRPDNLRLLCPNCDSQNLETRGGANAGRIEKLEDGTYFSKNKDGTRDAYLRIPSIGDTSALGTPTIGNAPKQAQEKNITLGIAGVRWSTPSPDEPQS